VYSTTDRASDASIEQPQRPAASPHSTSSSATSHANAYQSALATHHGYMPHVPVGPTGLDVGLAQSSGGHPDLRLTVPGAGAGSTAGQTTSWHQPSTHYSSDLLSASRDRGASRDFASYMSSTPVPIAGGASGGSAGIQASAQYSQQYAPVRACALTSQAAQSGTADARFVPLQDYEEQSQQTSSA